MRGCQASGSVGLFLPQDDLLRTKVISGTWTIWVERGSVTLGQPLLGTTGRTVIPGEHREQLTRGPNSQHCKMPMAVNAEVSVSEAVLAVRPLGVLRGHYGNSTLQAGTENAGHCNAAKKIQGIYFGLWWSLPRKEVCVCVCFLFFPWSLFISEKVNAQFDGFSPFMWSCFRLFEHETIFWSHSIFSEK